MLTMRVYGINGEKTGYTVSNGTNEVCHGNTPSAFSLLKYPHGTKFDLLEEYTGQKAYTKYWKIEFEELIEEEKAILTAVFPKILGDIEKKENIKMPKKALAAAKANILKNHKELMNVCSRCGGSGEYSWNQRDGSRCFKCGGNKYIFPKFTKKYIEKVKKAYTTEPEAAEGQQV